MRCDSCRRYTHRPFSYTLEAMGEISELISKKPSYGRSSRGLTIVALICAYTLPVSSAHHLSVR